MTWKVTVFKPSGEPSDLPPDAVLRSTFKVGRRYRCTMTLDCAAAGSGGTGFMRAQWEPELPKQLNKREIGEYRTGRDALYNLAANVIGGAIALAE